MFTIETRRTAWLHPLTTVKIFLIVCILSGCDGGQADSNQTTAKKSTYLSPPFSYPSPTEIEVFIKGKAFKSNRVLEHETFSDNYEWSGIFVGIDLKSAKGRWHIKRRSLNSVICVKIFDARSPKIDHPEFCRAVNTIANDRMSLTDDQFSQFWYDAVLDKPEA